MSPWPLSLATSAEAGSFSFFGLQYVPPPSLQPFKPLLQQFLVLIFQGIAEETAVDLGHPFGAGFSHFGKNVLLLLRFQLQGGECAQEVGLFDFLLFPV